MEKYWVKWCSDPPPRWLDSYPKYNYPYDSVTAPLPAAGFWILSVDAFGPWFAPGNPVPKFRDVNWVHKMSFNLSNSRPKLALFDLS